MTRREWIECRFREVPIFALKLDMDVSIRLYAFGYRTVGSVDDLVGEYRENVLFELVGKKAGQSVIAALSSYCRSRLLDRLRCASSDASS